MDKELKNKKVKMKFREEIEPQEIFLDSLAQKKEEEVDIWDRKLEVPLSKKIPIFLYIFFFIIILVFWGKTFQLQILKGEEFSLKSEENRLRFYQIRPIRGVIYDSGLKQLVRNKSSFDLVLDKRDLPLNREKRTKVLREAAEIIKQINPEELERKIEESKLPLILILENIDHSTLISFESKMRGELGFSAFRIEENTVRDYIDDSTFSHLIGYTGKINLDELTISSDYSITDYIGKTGIEKSYEDLLRGKPGNLRIEKNALGKEIGESVEYPAEAGKSLVLWMDADFQKKIEEELKKQLEVLGGKKATAVALNPKNGGVLALVSIPDFDNNLFSQGISLDELKAIQDDPLKPFLNRAVSGEYLVGSTIKPLIASAVLQEKIISPDQKIDCQGMISVPNPYYPEAEPENWEYHDWKTHGSTDMRKAIAESCNVYFYTVGGGYKNFKGLGAEKIKEYLKLFNWGEKTGIDLPNEKNGLIPDPRWKKEVIGEEWTIGNTYHLSIGQGYINATPLQVVVAFSTIANNGTLYQPTVVQKILDSSTKEVIEEIQPKIIRENFIEPENLQVVREGMRGGVIYGSSVLLNNLPVKAAAKTGTAQTKKEDYYQNWVTVFAPYDDPQIVLTIVIEEVKGLQAAALPAAKEILMWYFAQSST